MALQGNFEVEIIEKELINVELVEKEIITVELKVIDILDYYRRYTESNLKQEVPTHVSGLQFQTSSFYASGSLKVYINGIKEKISQIQEDSNRLFTLLDSIDLALDYVEVEYLESSV